MRIGTNLLALISSIKKRGVGQTVSSKMCRRLLYVIYAICVYILKSRLSPFGMQLAF